MRTEKFNGYTNVETWLVMLWLYGDEHTGRVIKETKIYLSEEKLKNFIEENNPLSNISSLYSDLLNCAIREVNFKEISKILTIDNEEQIF